MYLINCKWWLRFYSDVIAIFLFSVSRYNLHKSTILKTWSINYKICISFRIFHYVALWTLVLLLFGNIRLFYYFRFWRDYLLRYLVLRMWMLRCERKKNGKEYISYTILYFVLLGRKKMRRRKKIFVGFTNINKRNNYIYVIRGENKYRLTHRLTSILLHD